MGTTNCPEIREVPLSPEERAQARDSYVRNFDRQFKDWQEIAKCCLSVKRDEDWKTLGFESFARWLHDAAPASERYLYLAMGLWENLSPDIPEDKLNEIPLGTAAILQRQVKSAKLRKDPKILEAAKQKPKKFIADMKELAPDQHVELRHRITLDFEASAWSVIEATFEKYKVMEGECSLETFIEWMCSEVSEWTLHADKTDEGRQEDLNRKRVQ
jgi:hypothetical protein